MIILPERNVARGKVLLPMKRRAWMRSSQEATFSGVPNQTRWRLTAKLDDGYIVWKGFFDDREDADEFLHAMAMGTLEQQPYLWGLASPMWDPNIGENLSYEFATIEFLTSSPGTTQAYTIPYDWNSLNNSIEVIGGGGWTGVSSAQQQGSGGGGYSKSTNIVATKLATAYYNVAIAGTKANGISNGGTSWFNVAANTAPTSSSTGASAQGGFSQSSGGQASSGIGTLKYSGGTGGGTNTYSGGGGGGAAGPNGNGANGGAGGNNNGGGGGGAANGGSAGQTGGSRLGGSGGNNRFGTGGGAGGVSNTDKEGKPGTDGAGGGGGYAPTNSTRGGYGGTGGSGTEWDATHGCGGGGGAAGDGDGTPSGNLGGDAGLYGGGGGGFGDDSSSQGGDGGQGIVVVTYNPVRISFNMPMLGM